MKIVMISYLHLSIQTSFLHTYPDASNTHHVPSLIDSSQIEPPSAKLSPSKTSGSIYFLLLNILLEKIHIIKETPLIHPRKFSIRPIHNLQPIVLIIRPKLIVSEERPRKRTNDVDVVFVDALQHLAEEAVVVEGSFEVVASGDDSSGGLHERVEAEFGDEDAGGFEGLPDVEELLADVLGRDIGVAGKLARASRVVMLSKTYAKLPSPLSQPSCWTLVPTTQVGQSGWLVFAAHASIPPGGEVAKPAV